MFHNIVCVCVCSTRVIPGHAGMSSSVGSTNGNSSNSGNASGSGSSPDTPTTSAAKIVMPTTTTITMPLSNPSILAVQRASQKRHSLTAISGHKLTPQQIGHQHRHSMELSGTSLTNALATMSASMVVVPTLPEGSTKSQVLPQVSVRQVRCLCLQ